MFECAKVDPAINQATDEEAKRNKMQRRRWVVAAANKKKLSNLYQSSLKCLNAEWRKNKENSKYTFASADRPTYDDNVVKTNGRANATMNSLPHAKAPCECIAMAMAGDDDDGEAPQEINMNNSEKCCNCHFAEEELSVGIASYGCSMLMLMANARTMLERSMPHTHACEQRTHKKRAENIE